MTLLDYTPGGPDFRPDLFGLGDQRRRAAARHRRRGGCSVPLPTCHGTELRLGAPASYDDIGGDDEVHGESGDDTVYTGCGNDVVFGDAQDDDIDRRLGQRLDLRRHRRRTASSATTAASSRAATGAGVTGRPRPGTARRAPAAATHAATAEPLYGVAALLADRPGHEELATATSSTSSSTRRARSRRRRSTSPARSKKAVDLTPFNVDAERRNSAADQPLYDANNSDDIIFGGWDDDFLHGGSGDDAISGAEALADVVRPALRLHELRQTQRRLRDRPRADRLDATRTTRATCSTSAPTPTRGTRTSHVAPRLGEFLLYDEYDPRRTILFNADGTVALRRSNGGHDCTGTPARASVQYFLNNDASDGRDRQRLHRDVAEQRHLPRRPATATQRRQRRRSSATSATTGWSAAPASDTIWGGWGNDLLNADDDLSTAAPTATNGCNDPA